MLQMEIFFCMGSVYIQGDCVMVENSVLTLPPYDEFLWHY